MNDYWLAKLISSVGKVDSRKRLQKAVYLLQSAGCPLKCDYILHYYGPYSFDVAALVNCLDGADIIEETPKGNRYEVHSIDKGKAALKRFEKTPKGKSLLSQIQQFVPLFEQLNAENLWVLELAATITYFHQNDWTEAKEQTAKFKSVPLTDSKLQKAEELAKKFQKAT